MRAYLVASTVILASACSQVDPFTSEERADIDCLAAITVVEITNAIRDGTENGMGDAELAAIRPAKIADAIARLDEKYPNRMDEAYLEYDINNRLGKIEEAIRSSRVRACVTGGGSMLRVHLKGRPPRNYREAFMTPEENRQLKVLLDHLFDAGFLMINTCSATLSTAMGEAEVDAFVQALERGLSNLG